MQRKTNAGEVYRAKKGRRRGEGKPIWPPIEGETIGRVACFLIICLCKQLEQYI